MSFEINEIGAGTTAAARPPAPHMQTGQAYSVQAKHAVVPSSWGIGTFHQNNPIYNQRVVMEAVNHVTRGTSSRQVVSASDCESLRGQQN